MTKKTYHHKDLKNTLLKAANQTLQKDGIAGLSLRQLAKDTGVSHNAPYRHFKDKGALLMALAEYGFNELEAAMQAASNKHSALPDQLKAAGYAYITHATTHPELHNLMFGGIIPQNKKTESLQHAGQRAFECLENLIKNGQSQAIFKSDSTESLSLAAWSMVHGLSALMISGNLDERFNQKDIMEAVQKILATGMMQA